MTEQVFKVGQKVKVNSGNNLSDPIFDGKTGVIRLVEDGNPAQPQILVTFDNIEDGTVWCYAMKGVRELDVEILEDVQTS